MQPTPRVFISYARADGEESAAALRRRLEREQPEITLWQDRTHLEGGVGWWRQITEALDSVEFLIMIMTPAAMTSETARKEWRYARQQGVRVCPVQGVPATSLDFGALPRWMRKAHFYDLGREWDTFVGFLKSAPRATRVPFMAPDVSEGFIRRPDELYELLSHLLDESGSNPVATTAVLQGPGGFGKSTIAADLCHDERVIDAFDDGVLWTSLGEHPNLQHELAKLYAALTAERPAFIDADDAAVQLAERLQDKSCLVVVDDAWDANDVKPFLRGGRHCARLITTRRLPVAMEAGPHRVLVNEMTEGQAVQLLTGRLPARDLPLPDFRALAQRLGRWPLMLKLAASQLRERVERGDTVEGALSYVGRALDKRGVVAFDRAKATERNDAIAKTIAASMELLDDEARWRCIELSIFPEAQRIPLGAVGALWGTDEFDTEDRVQLLDGAALVEFDLKMGCLRLHGVLQAFLRTQLDDAATVHRRLVHEGWGNLAALPDPYAWRSLSWHLIRAGEPDRLRDLLLDFDWLQAKLRATDPPALLEDFERCLDGEGLRLVHEALRLSMNGLSVDEGQLAVQLLGRLERGRVDTVDALLDQAVQSAPRPWLRLASDSLTHPGGALTGILKGHSAPVEAVAISADGRWVLSGSADWTLRLWDLPAGRVLKQLEGHGGSVYGVAIAGGVGLAVSGSEDRTLRAWDLDQGTLRATIRGHYGAVTGVAITPGGERVASVSDDGTVRVWDLRTGKEVAKYRESSHRLRAVAITPDGRRLLYGAADWSVRVLELAAGEEVTRLRGHDGIVLALAIGTDGRTVLSGSDDQTLRVWDAQTGELRHVLEGHAGPVEAAALSPDGTLAISGHPDGSLRVWRLGTGECGAVLSEHSDRVRSLSFFPASRRVLSASWDRTLRHWNAQAPAVEHSVRAHAEPVAFLTLSVDGARAVSGTRSGSLLAWDVERGRTTAELGYSAGEPRLLTSLRMMADGRRVLTASRDRTLRLWDTADARELRVMTGHTGGIKYLAVSACGRHVVTLGWDRSLRLWDLERGRARRILMSPPEAGQSLSDSRASALLMEVEAAPIVDIAGRPVGLETKIAVPAGGKVVILGASNTVGRWDLEQGTTTYEEVGDFETVAIAADSGSRRAVLASRFGALRIWDIDAAETRHVWEGHGARILDVVIWPDERTVVTAATNDTIRLWDFGTGGKRGGMAGRFGRAEAVVIAPSGRYVYSVYGDTLSGYTLPEGRHLGGVSFDFQIVSIAVAPDGHRLAVGDVSGRVHFLRLET